MVNGNGNGRLAELERKTEGRERRFTRFGRGISTGVGRARSRVELAQIRRQERATRKLEKQVRREELRLRKANLRASRRAAQARSRKPRRKVSVQFGVKPFKAPAFNTASKAKRKRRRKARRVERFVTIRVPESTARKLRAVS